MYNQYKAELYNLMVIQEQSNDFIEKITKAGEIFEYIRIHKNVFKYGFPVLYSVSVQRAIVIERDLKYMLNHEENTQEEEQILQECLRKVNLFQWNI
jgi:hypothetical protein